MKKILFVALLIGYKISLWGGVYGLLCQSCYPCKSDDDGEQEVCDEAGHQDLPDTGYFGCSYERGAGSTLRKRCIWLRNDPDDTHTYPSPRPLRCSLSPFDDIFYDCYCFSDNCNKKKLDVMMTSPLPLEFGGNGHKDSSWERGNGKTLNVRPTTVSVLSTSILGVILLQAI